MKVLISGAGIAGNSLAFWLSKLGHDITVIERFPTLRTTGLQLDLRGHGIEVMKRMGLEQAFRAKTAPEQGLQVVDSLGKQRAYFPANKSGAGLQNFTTEYEIMRGDLCRLLHDATKDRVKYVFGASIESFQNGDDSVEVRFADGKEDHYDLLVGADGQGSRTRRMMLGSDPDESFHPLGGVYVGYFTIPRPIQAGEGYLATAYTAPGHRAIMTRRHNPDQMQIYLFCKTDSEKMRDVRRGDVQAEKEALAELFQGAGWETDDILQSMQGSKDFYCERMGLVKMDSWSRGRVTLVGDAGYCPSAMTGMGTTSAMVGAYVLAGEIGKHFGGLDEAETGGPRMREGLYAALQAYEQAFRPFMDQVQKGISETGGMGMMPSTPFGIAIMNHVLGCAAYLKLNVIGKWFLREDVKGWQLPEYPDTLNKL